MAAFGRCENVRRPAGSCTENVKAVEKIGRSDNTVVNRNNIWLIRFYSKKWEEKVNESKQILW